MKASRNSLRHAALCLALGACLSTMAPAVMAQSATGAVAGRGNAGDQITVTNEATGLSRTVTVNADGSYRVSQLPVGDYRLQTTRDGQAIGASIPVNVELGGTTTVNLGSEGAVTNLGAIQVIGSRIVNRVDVYSTESATNVTREEIARLPVDQSLGSVALLAPGVIGGNASFGGISFGGSSVAENSTFINGLNVTDFYRRQGFSTAPFAFYREFQVKTGGYSVEFGRSTGGVINAVTRSGSNEFESGIEFTFEPDAWRARADDHYFEGRDSTGQLQVARFTASRDTQNFGKYNVWASGPIVKDRLFFFAMYEVRDNSSRFTNQNGDQFTDRKSDNGFWGTKLDWNLTDNHLLELLAFSDAGDQVDTTTSYDLATGTRFGAPGIATVDNGGKSGSLTYTGQFGDNFVAKAMYGVNRSSFFARSPFDGPCSQITIDASYRSAYTALGLTAPGCHPTTNLIVEQEDEREAARLDFEWSLGDHQLRFGLDRELMKTDRFSRYPGPDGIRYTAFARTSPTQVLDNGALLPTGVNAFVLARRRFDGGDFETTANAYYLEDNWNVTPNLLLNLGVRVDGFDNKDATGSSFIKMDDLVSPRVGFSWNMRGDNTAKLFGNLGRYYLPVTNIINYTFAGGLTDERSFFTLNGWRADINPLNGASYPAPILGPQIGGVFDDFNIDASDTRKTVDRELDAVYQDEAILGFQQALGAAWSWGANATYRRMTNAMEDIRINHTPCGPVRPVGSTALPSSLFPVGNPGEPLTIWGDASIGCTTEGWITIDTSRDGYITQGSNRVTGYSDPKRTYKSVEFQLDRAWDGKWAFNASYLWSKSEGNLEGPVNSDTGFNDTGLVQHYDHPANNEDYGLLFNDRRHQIKLRGSYALNQQWLFGGTLNAQSGGPINEFGVTWPDDLRGGASFTSEGLGGGTFWHCVQNCSGPLNQRVYEYAPRGSGGRLPWTYNMGASITWTAPVEGLDLKARLSVYNLTNEQEVINVRQRYESNPGVVRPLHGTGTRWQSPRYTQLVITWNF